MNGQYQVWREKLFLGGCLGICISLLLGLLLSFALVWSTNLGRIASPVIGVFLSIGYLALAASLHPFQACWWKKLRCWGLAVVWLGLSVSPFLLIFLQGDHVSASKLTDGYGWLYAFLVLLYLALSGTKVYADTALGRPLFAKTTREHNELPRIPDWQERVRRVLLPLAFISMILAPILLAVPLCSMRAPTQLLMNVTLSLWFGGFALFAAWGLLGQAWRLNLASVLLVPLALLSITLYFSGIWGVWFSSNPDWPWNEGTLQKFENRIREINSHAP